VKLVLNSSSKSESNVRINSQSASGSIGKTHPKSFFQRFHINSDYAARMRRNEEDVILQVLVCYDGYMIAETVKAKNY